MNNFILKVNNISKNFGGVSAVNDLSFGAKSGQVVAVIGPNGAGKTTLFNMISGLQSPDEGEIWYSNHRIDNLDPSLLAGLGIARTFQNVKLFGNMNVCENVMMGRYCHERTSFFMSAIGFSRKEEIETRRAAVRTLKRVGLEEKAEVDVTSLPLGEQRIVELARAMMIEPLLLLLDEPTAGLNSIETIRLAATINRIRANNITVLLVEHDMNMVMSIADWIVVLNFGKKLAEDTPHNIQSNPVVVETYLGTNNHKPRDGEVMVNGD